MWTYAVSYLNGEKMLENYMKRNWKLANQTETRVEKIIKRKDEKLYSNEECKIITLIGKLK